MNFIDAFFVDNKYFQDMYKNGEVPIKELKKIPIEEILKSDKGISHIKRKQKKKPPLKNSTNKENEKSSCFSEVQEEAKSRKPHKRILTEVKNTEPRRSKRTCSKISNNNGLKPSLLAEDLQINKNKESLQGVLTEKNNVEPKQKKITNKCSTKNNNKEINLFSECHEKDKTTELSTEKLTKVNDSKIKQIIRVHDRTLRNNRKKIGHSAEDYEIDNIKEPSLEKIYETNAVATVRRSSRLKQKNPNFKFCANNTSFINSYQKHGKDIACDEIDNSNNKVVDNTIVKKIGKNIPKNSAFRANISKLKTKNIIPKNIDDKFNLRKSYVVCELLNETDINSLCKNGYNSEKVKKSYKSCISSSPERKLTTTTTTTRTQNKNITKTNSAAACIQNDDKSNQKQNKVCKTKAIIKQNIPVTKNTILENTSDKSFSRKLLVICEQLNKTDEVSLKLSTKGDNRKKKETKSQKLIISNLSERNFTTTRTLRKTTTKAKSTAACVQKDDISTQKQNKKRNGKGILNKSSSVAYLEEKNLDNQELTKEVNRTNPKSKNFPAEKSFKKGSKGTTLKYLKERRKFYKENVNKSKDLLEEFPLVKKNKALENLMKMNANESLTIRTPKLKNKQNAMGGITPRSDLIGELGKEFSTSNLITPKDTSKSKAKSKEDGALHVLYKHLDSKKSKKRKNSMNPMNISAKFSKLSNDQSNLFKDVFEEEEWLKAISQKPNEDKSDTSDDDYFNQSV